MSSDDGQGTEEAILAQLAKVMEPIGEAAKNDSVEQLLTDMGLTDDVLGVKVDAVKQEVQKITSDWNTLESAIIQPLSQGNEPDLSNADDVFKALKSLFKTIKSLDDIEAPDPDVEAIGERVFDYLLIVYLADEHPTAHSLLVIIGVIKPDAGPGAAGDLDLAAFANVFASPKDLAGDLFNWGKQEFEPYVVLFYVKGVISALGLEAAFQEAAQDVQQAIDGLNDGSNGNGANGGTGTNGGGGNGNTGGNGGNGTGGGGGNGGTGTNGGSGTGGGNGGPAVTGPSAEIANKQLNINVFTVSDSSGSGEMGIHIIPVPGKNDDLPGLAIRPFTNGQAEVSEDLDQGWSFNAKVSGNANWAMKITADTSGKIQPEMLDLDTSAPVEREAHADAKLTYEPSGEAEITPILGDPEKTGIGVRYFQTHAKIDYDGETVVFVVEIPARGRIQVTPEGGFLKKVVPDGVAYDFDATVGWSSESGFYFERGGTLEMSLAQQKQLGPLLLEEIYAAVEPDSPSEGSGGGGGGSSSGSGGSAGGGGGGGLSGGGGGSTGGGDSSGGGVGADADVDASASADVDLQEGTITIQGAASGTVELGPVKASVKRMGVQGEVSFPEDGGNLGPAQLDMAFKPPEGVGISIEAGAVSGGGYLEFDHENERYAGVLQIKAGSLTINAVGLLTTELPGGKDGFSLLLIISGEFSPVQLGFGFTLNGVGGIVGVNRSMKRKPLGKAARTGSMDSVLFPENPVANSQRIISDLRAIFPPSEGTHVFGPMARLGWGTPTLITADLAVVLEVPTWKIALLGRLSALLPDEKAPLIELNLSVAGFLDPPNKQVAIDASLYDSRIVMWTVSGDMAMRSNYGDDPRFLLSVGGWNPRYDPPKGFPELRRVKANLGAPGGNPKIEFTGYFAVTSNTVQAGAGVHALAKAGPAKIEGKLSFDALIQFNPFKFIVDFHASFSVEIKGKGLSITIDGTLSGPGPFRIKGTIKINILFIEIKVRADVTIGPSKEKEELPPAKVLPKLVAELNKPANWRAQLPESGASWATFREVEAGEGEVLAHPMGEIGVRQTIAPLQFQLEKFGNATPSGYTRFEIDGATVSGSASIEFDATTKEDFAPAQFSKLSDSEKMNSPAFEKHPAGQKMRHSEVYCGYPEGKRNRNRRQTKFGYECTVIDRTKDNWGVDLGELGRFKAEGLPSLSGLTNDQVAALSEVGAVAHSPARMAGNQRFRLDETDQAIVDAQDGGAVSMIDGTDGSEATVRGGGDPDSGGLAGSITMGESRYVIARASDMQRVDLPTADGELSKSQAQRALSRFRSLNPAAAKQLRVVKASRARTDGSGGGSR
ncbi:MAG: DUF6603 domain-containing protein [Halapricum sp.]